MKKTKLPNPIIMIFGSMGAFWIADIVNPGFNPVGVMFLLFIPVLIFEILYPQSELEQIIERPQPVPIEDSVPDESGPAEMAEKELASQ